MGTQGIRVGALGVKVGMQGIKVGMQRMGVGILGMWGMRRIRVILHENLRVYCFG